MLVAFIARANPLAVIPVAILLGGIGASGGLLQRVFELPDATVNVLQGILFLSILLSETLLRAALVRRAARRRRHERDWRASLSASSAARSASARRSCSSAWASA